MILLCFTANLFCQKQTENSEVRVLLNFSNSLLTNQYKSVSIDSIRSLKIQKIFTTDRQKTRFVGFKFYMIEFQFLIKQIFSF